MMPLGTTAPDFTLLEVTSGNMVSLQELRSEKATVIMFVCNHCPYVKHINQKLVEVAEKYMKRGASFIAISSNDVEKYPEDGPEKKKETAAEEGYPFPYLFDESQQVAKAYDAACTPDFYIFDKNLGCAYRGQFDGSRPKSDVPVTGQDLTAALEEIMAGKAVSAPQKPGIGCNIKWKA